MGTYEAEMISKALLEIAKAIKELAEAVKAKDAGK